jgi:hypothetical protein
MSTAEPLTISSLKIGVEIDSFNGRAPARVDVHDATGKLLHTDQGDLSSAIFRKRYGKALCAVLPAAKFTADEFAAALLPVLENARQEEASKPKLSKATDAPDVQKLLDDTPADVLDEAHAMLANPELLREAVDDIGALASRANGNCGARCTSCTSPAC